MSDQRGDKGSSRLSARVAWSVVILFVLAAAIGVVALLGQVHESSVNQAAQRRAGQAVERKLCATLDDLAALQPPAGNPATNPARSCDQASHAALDQLGADLGCMKETR